MLPPAFGAQELADAIVDFFQLIEVVDADAGATGLEAVGFAGLDEQGVGLTLAALLAE